MDSLVPLASPEDCDISVYIFPRNINYRFIAGNKKTNRFISPTQKGVSSDLPPGYPLIACKKCCSFFHDSVSQPFKRIDRIDIRPDKGIVKFTFKDHFKGLQLDGTTGKLLSIETRKSDFIEKLHDGSILDKIFGTGG